MENGKGMIKRIFFIFLGSFINAVAINMFIIPNKFLSGGVAGLAIIIHYITSISSGFIMFILNIPIFILGMKEADKEFMILSLIGMFSLSLFLILTSNMNLFGNASHDPLLSSIYAGVIGGLGVGLVFKNRASLGGTDIIAVVLKKKSGISIATISFTLNALVVLSGAFISGIEVVLYTLISMYISSVVMGRVIEGFDRKRLLLIVTSKEKEVSEYILKNLGRGVTFLYGEGAYTGERKKILYCIVTLNQLTRMKKIVEDIDPSAFMSILDAAEVHGKGFKKPAI